MQNNPFIRIDNRLVMEMEKPTVKETPFGYVGLEAFREWERRPSYPINPADLDKFEEGKQYWEGKDFKVKKYYSCSLNNVCDCDNGQLCPRPNKEPFATEAHYLKTSCVCDFPESGEQCTIHTPNDRREYEYKKLIADANKPEDVKMRNDLAEILKDNIYYSGQLDGFVVHGAIDKIIEYFKNDRREDQDELWIDVGIIIQENEEKNINWKTTTNELKSKYTLTKNDRREEKQKEESAKETAIKFHKWINSQSYHYDYRSETFNRISDSKHYTHDELFTHFITSDQSGNKKPETK